MSDKQIDRPSSAPRQEVAERVRPDGQTENIAVTSKGMSGIERLARLTPNGGSAEKLKQLFPEIDQKIKDETKRSEQAVNLKEGFANIAKVEALFVLLDAATNAGKDGSKTLGHGLGEYIRQTMTEAAEMGQSENARIEAVGGNSFGQAEGRRFKEIIESCISTIKDTDPQLTTLENSIKINNDEIEQDIRILDANRSEFVGLQKKLADGDDGTYGYEVDQHRLAKLETSIKQYERSIHGLKEDVAGMLERKSMLDELKDSIQQLGGLEGLRKLIPPGETPAEQEAAEQFKKIFTSDEEKTEASA